jgi:2-aminoethylphosphonate-pyruvate transaminase
MILLNPGPVIVSESVRKALLKPDICHREAEFAELLNEVRAKLTKVFKANRNYSTVILGGSGTASLEAVISSVVRAGRLLVLSNGYYGEKIADIARIHGIDTRAFRKRWGEQISIREIERTLKADKKIRHVATVHNETSTGMLNDVSAIGKLVSQYKKTFIVDAISSVGAEDLSVSRDEIHFCVGTPNKCIESVPGLSFVCVNRKELQKLKGLPAKSSYLDLYNHYVYEEGSGERSGTPFTPPVQAVYALDKALNLLFREGIGCRRRRYSSAAKRLRDGLEQLGFRLFLPRQMMSNSITSIVTPRNITYGELHDRLKDKGFIIYAGQGKLITRIFRVANMGALTKRDLNGFLHSMKMVLQDLNVTPEY